MLERDRELSQLPKRFFAALVENPVTALLVAINFAMFGVLLVTDGPNDTTNLYRWGAKFGPAIQNGDWFRLFTPIVLHAGWMHLAANTFALVIFGPRLEHDFGWFAFLATYLVSGVCGVAASYLVSPALSVGASGAIFGIVGAYGIFLLRNRKEFGVSVNPVLTNLAIVLVINIIFGLLIPGIDQGAHVGGLIAGVAIGWVLSPGRVVTIEDDFFLFGAPLVKTRFQRASMLKVVLCGSLGLVVATAITWWVSNAIDYDPATMAIYGFYELTTR